VHGVEAKVPLDGTMVLLLVPLPWRPSGLTSCGSGDNVEEP
jgi:hypothetical protein